MHYSNDLCDDFEHLSISRNKKKCHSRKAVTYTLIKLDVQNMGIGSVYGNQLGGGHVDNIFINNVLEYRNMNNTTEKYKDIKKLFFKNNLALKSVKEVINPYIKMAFEIKRKFAYNNKIPVELFHGTKNKYIDNICTYNFDWRFSGIEKGHRHGKGVYFTTKPHFAALFCDKKCVKQMIIADVLVEKLGEGTENLLLPPYGTDTTFGKNKMILTKFYDNEFCPKYIVRFYCI